MCTFSTPGKQGPSYILLLCAICFPAYAVYLLPYFFLSFAYSLYTRALYCLHCIGWKLGL